MESSITKPAAGESRAPLVGRDRELATLTAGLDAALSGRGHLYLIGGEPRVGKTRLLEEVTAEATARSAIVVWGRCWEGDDAPPFWPWVQVLRALLAREEGASAARADVHAAAQVARLIPPIQPQ